MDEVYGIQASYYLETNKPEAVIPSPAVPAEPVTALAHFRGGIGEALKSDALHFLSLKVPAVETLQAASSLADVRANVKLLLKDIEDRRKRTVEPLKKQAAAVDAEAHVWTDPLRAWDKKAEAALLAFQHLQADRARREAEAKQKQLVEAATRQAEAEAAGNAAEAEAASLEIARAEAVAEPVEIRGWRTDSGTTSKRTRWVVEVVDPLLVPPAYLVPDLPRLQAAVNAGAREIEGCSISQVESLAVRTR